jgi:hypothetical protein
MPTCKALLARACTPGARQAGHRNPRSPDTQLATVASRRQPRQIAAAGDVTREGKSMRIERIALMAAFVSLTATVLR